MKFLYKVFFVANFINFSLALYPIRNTFLNDNNFPKPPVAIAFAGETVITKWIQQRLNNFDENDGRTWQMRYMENNFFLKDGGPIFIFVGGEIDIVEGWLLGGHMRDMAIELDGGMFYVEHRYYGQSRPTADISSENLRFLTIEQALADLAQFIIHIKQSNNYLTSSPVILVGASYAASIVTWFIQEYPQFAVGGWASSAPLHAQLDFLEYREIVSEALGIIGGNNCSGRVRRAFDKLDAHIAAGESAVIEKLFNLCFPLNLANQLDIWNFFNALSNSFSYIVQSHREINQDIQRTCTILNGQNGNGDLEALSYLWLSQNEFCLNHPYLNFVHFYNSSSWEDNQHWFGVRQWTYQTCAEFGWFQSTSSNNTVFGSNVDVKLFLQLCMDFFGAQYSSTEIQRSVDRTNEVYRARSPDVRNVYSTHGQFDPWRPMGVQMDINEYSPTVILPYESHCSDLYSISWYDSPELRASKEKIFQLVQQWIRKSI